MNKASRIIPLLFSVLCGLLLVACTANSEDSNHFQNIEESNFQSPSSNGNSPTSSSEHLIQYEDVSIEITFDSTAEPLCADAQKYFYLTGNNTLLRFNKNTGEGSSVCPDPLCRHDTDECEFFSSNINALYSITGNTIYYTRDTKQTVGSSDELWVYDLTTGKAKKLYEAYKRILTVQAIPAGCYFTDLIIPSASELSKTGYHTEFYFVDVTGTITKLATFKGIFNISSVRDGRLWWYENGGGDYVSDLYGKNFTAYDTATQRPVKENYAYFMRMTAWSEGRATTALMRMNLNTGKEEELLSSCALYTIHDNYIYYFDYLETPAVIGQQSNSSAIYTDSFGGKLYRMDLNGENKTLLINNDHIYFSDLPAVRNSPLMDDRYIGISIVKYERSIDGIVTNQYPSLLIYDTQTGEYRIGVYEP